MDFGLTLSEALLIASIPGIIAAILGYFLSLKIAGKNISQQVKEELEKEKTLLDEKIRKDRADRFWNMKFGLYSDIHQAYSDFIRVVVDADDKYFKTYNRVLEGLITKCTAIFDDEKIADKLADIREIFGENVKDVQNDEVAEKTGILFRDTIQLCKKELVKG